MKALLIISISALSLFVVDTWKKQHSPLASGAGIPAAVHHVSAEKNTPKIWVKNPLLYKGEILELQLSAPNAPYLGVIDPEGHFFYVVFPVEPMVGDLTPLVESKHFIHLQTLSIDTRFFRADPYTYDITTNQPVFTKSGAYTFITGEDLHVDDPALLDKVTVQYVNSRKPVKAATVFAKSPPKADASNPMIYKRT